METKDMDRCLATMGQVPRYPTLPVLEYLLTFLPYKVSLLPGTDDEGLALLLERYELLTLHAE